MSLILPTPMGPVQVPVITPADGLSLVGQGIQLLASVGQSVEHAIGQGASDAVQAAGNFMSTITNTANFTASGTPTAASNSAFQELAKLVDKGFRSFGGKLADLQGQIDGLARGQIGQANGGWMPSMNNEESYASEDDFFEVCFATDSLAGNDGLFSGNNNFFLFELFDDDSSGGGDIFKYALFQSFSA